MNVLVFGQGKSGTTVLAKSMITESGHVTDPDFWNFRTSLGECGHLLRDENCIRGELSRLEAYLGFRAKLAGIFYPEDVATLQPLIAKLLEKMGYPDWEPRPAERLNPAHFSEYLVRLREERRPR